MIISFYLSSSELTISQCSIILVKNNKVVPAEKVIINSINKLDAKEAFSNYLLENGATNKLMHDPERVYTEADVLWYPSAKTDIYRSYAFSTNLNGTSVENPSKKPGANQLLNYILANDWSKPTVYIGKFGVTKSPDPHMPELPSPVLLVTTGGTTIKFSYTSTFADIEYECPCSSNGITFVYNLIPGKTYYYKVYNSSTPILNIYNVNKNYGTFTTKGLTRMIRLEHVRNVRDIGGYPTTSGSRMRYGLIYRGSLLDALGGLYNVTKAANQTTFDKNEFQKLGITLELDLRDNLSGLPTNGISSMGSNITYFKVNGTIQPYEKIVTDNGVNLFLRYLQKLMNNVAQGLATYVHCQLGRDRTGTFIALLMAICGVKSDYVLKDYELTSFWGNTTTRYTFLNGAHEKSISNSYRTWLVIKNAANSSATTIEGIAKDWFRKIYNSNTIRIKDNQNTTITDGDLAIKQIKSSLLEDYSGDTSSTDQFTIYPWLVSTSEQTIRRKTNDYADWKFYEVAVSAGDLITVNHNGSYLGFIETQQGLIGDLGTKTSDISTGFTSWLVDYYESNLQYSVKHDGYLLIATRSGNNAVVSKASQPADPYANGYRYLLGNYSVSSWGNSRFEAYYILNGGDIPLDLWEHYFIPVHKGQIVVTKFYNLKPILSFVESTQALADAIQSKKASSIKLTQVNGNVFNINNIPCYGRDLCYHPSSSRTYNNTVVTAVSDKDPRQYKHVYTVTKDSILVFSLKLYYTMSDGTTQKVSINENNTRKFGLYLREAGSTGEPATSELLIGQHVTFS